VHWSYAFAAANLDDGTLYTVQSRASDNASNTQTTPDSKTFTFDTAAPTATIAFPAAGGPYNAAGWDTGGAITGTAADGGSGVASVEVAIQDGSGNYYDGTSFSSATRVFLTASGTTSWSYAIASSKLTNGHTYNVTVKTADNTTTVNSDASAATRSFSVDTAAPTATIAFPAAGGFYNSAGWTGAITGTAADTGSGVASVKVAIQDGTGNYYDGTSFNNTAQTFLATSGSPTTWSFTIAAAELTDGHTYHATVKTTDNATAGNSDPSAATRTFSYDTTAPSTAIAFSPASPNGSSGWYKSAPTFTLSAGDGTSGVGSTSYQIDGGLTQTYSGAVSVPEGQHTISYWSTDNTGNVETTHTTGTIKVDTVNPSTTIAINPASPDGSTGWRVTATTFTLGASDATSSAASTFYKIDSGSTQTYSGSAVTVPEGQHTISYWSTDNAGNSEDPATTATIKVDTAKPATTITVNPASPSGSNGWYKVAAPTFTLAALDTGGSGVGSTLYKIDGGSTQTYPGSPVSIPEGSHTISYWSVDTAGNVETTHTTGTIKVDTVNPSTTIAINPASPDGSAGWRVSATSFTLSASDVTSGVVSTLYKIDGGSTQTYPGGPVSIPEGSHTISYWSTDTAGNTEATSTTGTVKVDTVKPSTTLTTSPVSPDGTNNWFKRSSVTFTLSGSDASSAVANSFYALDGGGMQTFSGTVTINTPGDHTVTYWSTDNAGNVETTNTTHIKLDNVNPTTTITTNPVSPDGTNNWFKRPSVTFTLSATDATSGVASRFYALDGGATQTYSGTATINTPGDHTVTYWSTDNAGNVEITNTTHIKLDNVNPTTTIAFSPASPNGTNSWYKTTAPTFTLSASDATSGVGSTSYQIDSGTTQTYSGAVSIPEGQHTIGYWSVDTAGNTETTHTTGTIKVDTVTSTDVLSLAASPAPVGAYLSANTLYFKGNAAGSFTLTDTPTDATSGVASATFPAISTTNWNGAGGTDSTSPLTSAYSWSSTTNVPANKTVTSVDNAGNTSAGATIAFSRDTTAPTGSVTYTSGYYTSANVSVSFSASDTGGSGVDSPDATLQRATATLANGTCGSFGAFSTIATGPTSPYSDTTVSSGSCYQYRYVVTDNVGNSATLTSASQAKVDPFAPTGSITAPADGSALHGSSVTVTSNSSDTGGSGVASAQFQVASHGGAFSNLGAADTTSPYSGTWNSATGPDGQYDLRVITTDNAGNTFTSSVITVTVDNTAPTGFSIDSAPSPQDGKPDSSDQILYTFSEQMDPNSIRSGWDGSSMSVTVHFDNDGNAGTSGLTVTGTALGNIDLGSTTYASNHGARFDLTGTMTMTTVGGRSVVTVTLTQNNSKQVTANTTWVWAPDPSATDLAGNATSTAVVTQAAAKENF
jgi:hypothetical protein